MLRNKFQDKQTFGSGEDFKRFLPYMSMGQSWSCDLDRDLDHLYKLLFPFPRRRHIEFGFDWLRCFRRCLQIWFIIYVRGPGPEADNSPGSFFLYIKFYERRPFAIGSFVPIDFPLK